MLLVAETPGPLALRPIPNPQAAPEHQERKQISLGAVINAGDIVCWRLTLAVFSSFPRKNTRCLCTGHTLTLESFSAACAHIRLTSHLSKE